MYLFAIAGWEWLIGGGKKITCMDGWYLYDWMDDEDTGC